MSDGGFVDFYIPYVDDMTAAYVSDIESGNYTGEIGLGEIHMCYKKEWVFSDKVKVHNETNIELMVNYILRKAETNPDTNDQMVPSHDAPHILAQVVMKLLKLNGFMCRTVPFPLSMGFPYESDLVGGLKVFSYAIEECPGDCYEVGSCPVKKEECNWDVGTKLLEYTDEITGEIMFVGFRCSHFLRSVSTIPMKDIIRNWLDVKGFASSNDPSRFLVATHSKCHGVAALIDVQKIV